MNSLKQIFVLLFILPLVTYSTLSYAQETESPVKKYKIYTSLGVLGNFSNSSSGSDESRDFQIAIAPFFGFAAGSFVIGTSFEYAYKNSESKTSINVYSSSRSTSESKTFAINPKVRYYSPFGLFLDGGYYFGKIDNYGITTNPNRYLGSSIYRLTGIVNGPSASIGYAIKAGTYFLIEPLVNCAYLTIKPDNGFAKEYNMIALNAGIGFTLRF